MKRFSSIVERASVDEGYLDVTKEVDDWLAECSGAPKISISDLPNTYVEGMISEHDETGVKTFLESSMVWNTNTARMALAAVLCEKIRLTVLDETGYRCSAGISNGKTMAKFACGLHKPNKQTLALPHYIPKMIENVPIFKLRNFGGNLGGELSSRFQVTTMGDLLSISRENLIKEFGEKNGNRVYDIARGIDDEAVVSRQLVKSIGCGKNFRGSETLKSKSKIMHWLGQMSEELEERLNHDRSQNNRIAEVLTIGALLTHADGKVQHSTKSVKLPGYDAKIIATTGYKALCKLENNTQNTDSDLWFPPITNLSLMASKFRPVGTPSRSIKTMFLKSSTHDNGLSRNKGFSPRKSPVKLKSESSRLSFLKKKKLEFNQDEEICEVTWADESERNTNLFSPEHEVAEDIPIDEHSDEELLSQRHGFEKRDESKCKLQKNFERVSQSIRSIIQDTLAAQESERTSSTEPLEIVSHNEVGGSFFRRKQLEQERLINSETSTKAPSGPNVSNSQVIDLESIPGTSRIRDHLEAPSSDATPKKQYYQNVDATSIDMSLLKQVRFKI